MFFQKNDISADLLGVFKIQRGVFSHRGFEGRAYDTLSLRLSGASEFKSDHTDLHVKSGDILYIPRNAQYQQSTTAETVIAVHFINNSSKNETQLEVLTLEDAAYVTDLFTQLYDVWKEKKQGHQYLCVSLFYKLLHFLHCQQVAQFTNRTMGEDKLDVALDFIHKNYRKESISISHLAKLCAVSETYFRKLFKKQHNVSPQQYIMNLKLEFAFHLLGSNLYTVSEVSQKSGFQDPKYFSRIFKQYYGYTPHEVQNKSDLFNPKQA